MCGVSLRDRISAENLMMRLGVEEVLDVVRRGRLRWFGHVERKQECDWASTCRNIKVPGSRGRGRPKKTWWQCVKNDICELKLKREMTKDRDLWRSAIYGNRPTCASM